MAIKRLFLIMLLFLFGYAAFAQAVPSAAIESSSYFIQETEEGARIMQRFHWAPIQGMLRYEFVLDRQQDGEVSYGAFINESTEDAFIELSLPAGKYRYKVLGYNILERVGAESEYRYFEVLQAFQPDISDINAALIFTPENSIHRITLDGEFLTRDSQIYLIPYDKTGINNSADQEGVLFPLEIIYDETGRAAELIVSVDNTSIDRFRIVALNPGGLVSVSEPVSIKKQMHLGTFNFSFGYAPLIPFYPSDSFPFSALQSDYHLSNVIDKNFYPVGYTTRFSLIPFNTRFGNFGIELSQFVNIVNAGNDSYNASTNIMGLALSLIRQEYLLDGKLIFNARIGGGIASFTDLEISRTDDTSTPETISVIFPEFQFGLSVQYLLYKEFFIELGLDAQFLFAHDMFTSYLSPTLTFGWHFFDMLNSADKSPNRAENREPVNKIKNIRFSLAYAPLIPVDLFNNMFPLSMIPRDGGLSTELSKSFYPLGFAASLSHIPSKTYFGNFGTELSFFSNTVNTKKDNDTFKATMLGINLSMLRQQPILDDKLILNTRIGAGIAFFQDLQFDKYASDVSDILNIIFPEIQIGVSAQYFLYKTLFVDAGLDMKLLFGPEMFASYLSPMLHFGWQF